MATPRAKRATTRVPVPVASAAASEPSANTTAAARMAVRRPVLSVNGPAISAPNTAPNNSEPTTVCCAASESPKSSLMNSSAPEMMPVS